MVNEDSPLNERINYYLQTEINQAWPVMAGRSC